MLLSKHVYIFCSFIVCTIIENFKDRLFYGLFHQNLTERAMSCKFIQLPFRAVFIYFKSNTVYQDKLTTKKSDRRIFYPR